MEVRVEQDNQNNQKETQMKKETGKEAHITAPLTFGVLWWLIGYAMLGLVVLLSLMPSPPMVIEFDFADKIEHFLTYGMLMGWFTQLVGRTDSQTVWCIGLILMGTGIEFLQAWGGIRYFETLDMLANTIGVLVGWVLSRTLFKDMLYRIDQQMKKHMK